jgi:hypothetical protein
MFLTTPNASLEHIVSTTGISRTSPSFLIKLEPTLTGCRIELEDLELGRSSDCQNLLTFRSRKRADRRERDVRRWGKGEIEEMHHG